MNSVDVIKIVDFLLWLDLYIFCMFLINSAAIGLMAILRLLFIVYFTFSGWKY